MLSSLRTCAGVRRASSMHWLQRGALRLHRLLRVEVHCAGPSLYVLLCHVGDTLVMCRPRASGDWAVPAATGECAGQRVA